MEQSYDLLSVIKTINLELLKLILELLKLISAYTSNIARKTTNNLKIREYLPATFCWGLSGRSN